MWWNVCGHANCDAGSSVDEQIRKGRWKNGWLGTRLVIIRDKVDRVLLHVGHKGGAEVCHARFSVTHRRRWIAFD